MEESCPLPPPIEIITQPSESSDLCDFSYGDCENSFEGSFGDFFDEYNDSNIFLDISVEGCENENENNNNNKSSYGQGENVQVWLQSEVVFSTNKK